MSGVLTAAQYQSLAKAYKKTRKSEELQLHKAIVHFLNKVLPGHAGLHIPNGEKRDARTAARLKAMGTRPGVPDFLLPMPGGRVLWMEIKKPGGRASKVQREYINKLRVLGHPVAIVESVDDVRNTLKALSITTKEAGA